MSAETAKSTSAKHSRSRIIIAVLVVVIVALLAFIFFSMNGSSGGVSSGGKRSLAETSNGEIATPVGTLNFPSELAEKVWLEETSAGGIYCAKFYTNAGSDKVLLFELSVGEGGEGYLLGSAPDADGTMQPVSLNISTIEAKSSWSDEDKDEINLLQGCVNDLIEQIGALDGYQGNA